MRAVAAHRQGAKLAADMEPVEERISELFEPVQRIIRAHPQGLSEHGLMLALDRQGVDGFRSKAFATPLSLYQCHFILFHVLYRLRDRLRTQQRGDLRIHVLRIILLPYDRAGQPTGIPERADDLRAYYLDLENLRRTSTEDVRALLEAFWGRFATHQAFGSRGEGGGAGARAQALAVLGLEAAADEQAILRQYRRLVMCHHPDRGGDKRRLQEINAAMAVLRNRRRT
jgi:hypothetical protein